MSIASRITSIEGHIQDAYTEISRLGVDLTNVDKNIENIADKLQDVYADLPKVSGEGSSLSLSPTRVGGLGIIPEGACEQDTIAYIDVGEWEQGFINTSGDNVNSNYWVRTSDYIPVKSNILYNITRTISTEYMAFMFYNSEKTFIGTNETADLITTNLPANQNRMRAGDTSIEVTINNLNVAYMRMTDASNNLSTVYTISTQAPTPDYPQDIKVVTGNNSVVVKIIYLILMIILVQELLFQIIFILVIMKVVLIQELEH